MSNPLENRRNSATWLEPLLVSSIRCHVLGGAISLALLLVIAWIWTHADAFTKDDRYTPAQLQQAAELVAHADNLRSKYADCLALSKQSENRFRAIQGWLPRSVDWKKTEQRIGEIAGSAEVELMSIDRGEKQTGQRVGTWLATCDVQGSYPGLCRFLHQLASEPQPIWCDSIRIHRTKSQRDATHPCSASVSIRVPYAADGTTAAKLFQSEIPDAT